MSRVLGLLSPFLFRKSSFYSISTERSEKAKSLLHGLEFNILFIHFETKLCFAQNVLPFLLSSNTNTQDPLWSIVVICPFPSKYCAETNFQIRAMAYVQQSFKIFW